jgi:glutamyl-tRNA synthetase
MLPYLQEAGYEESDRSWLTQLATLIGPSLTRLTDTVKESRLLLSESLNFTEDALTQLKQAGVKGILQEIYDRIEPDLTEETAREIVNQVTKSQGVKKGVVMKSLRAGLMGELQGPDLIQSWLLLHQKGWDKLRLQQSLTVA